MKKQPFRHNSSIGRTDRRADRNEVSTIALSACWCAMKSNSFTVIFFVKVTFFLLKVTFAFHFNLSNILRSSPAYFYFYFYISIHNHNTILQMYVSNYVYIKYPIIGCDIVFFSSRTQTNGDSKSEREIKNSLVQLVVLSLFPRLRFLYRQVK